MGNTVVCSVMGLPIAAQFFIFSVGFMAATMLWLSVALWPRPKR